MVQDLDLEVATPERPVVREHVSEVQVPAKNGYLGVLPGHAALLSKLGSGILSYTAGGRSGYLAIHGGFLEVLEDHVRVLADRAEKANEIDVERARKALERAQQRLGTTQTGVDIPRALSALKRAEARLEAASRR